MNTTVSEGEALAKALSAYDSDAVEMMVAPPFTHLDRVGAVLKDSKIAMGAQNISADGFGAHTGEIAGEMLADLGMRYVIVGHSEARGRGEDDALIREKAKRALECGLVAVICFGESAEIYATDERVAFLKRQVAEALKSADANAEVVLAYEPIWAIGTGKTADGDDADAVIGEIRASLPEGMRDSVRILYGGSVKAANVASFVSKENIDGVLVGGASLKADEFMKIADEASHV